MFLVCSYLLYIFKVQLTLYSPFCTKLFIMQFSSTSEKTFMFLISFFFLWYFEIQEVSSILVYGRVLKKTGNSRE